MSAEQTPDIAAVLAEHADYKDEIDVVLEGGTVFWRQRCICGHLLPRGGFGDDKHRAHIAAALAPVLAAAVREAEQRALRKAAEAGREFLGDETVLAWDYLEHRADRTTEPVSHETRATIAEAIAAWEAKGPTSLTVALMAEALYAARDGRTS